jgi:hypothetical protein
MPLLTGKSDPALWPYEVFSAWSVVEGVLAVRRVEAAQERREDAEWEAEQRRAAQMMGGWHG